MHMMQRGQHCTAVVPVYLIKICCIPGGAILRVQHDVHHQGEQAVHEVSENVRCAVTLALSVICRHACLGAQPHLATLPLTKRRSGAASTRSMWYHGPGNNDVSAERQLAVGHSPIFTSNQKTARHIMLTILPCNRRAEIMMCVH